LTQPNRGKLARSLMTEDGIKLEFFVKDGNVVLYEDGTLTQTYTPLEFLAKVAEYSSTSK